MKKPRSKLWRDYWRATTKVVELHKAWSASGGWVRARVTPTPMGRLRAAVARAAALEARIFARRGCEARYIRATEWMERESLRLGSHDPFVTPLGAAAWMVPGVDPHGACVGRSYLAP